MPESVGPVIIEEVTKMSSHPGVLRCALAIAAADPVGALRILESGLQVARAQGDSKAVLTLAKHAGTISLGMRQIDQALAYFWEARSCSDDGSVRMAIGLAYEELGDIQAAKDEYADCLRFAESCGDSGAVEMAAAALARLRPA